MFFLFFFFNFSSPASQSPSPSPAPVEPSLARWFKWQTNKQTNTQTNKSSRPRYAAPPACTPWTSAAAVSPAPRTSARPVVDLSRSIYLPSCCSWYFMIKYFFQTSGTCARDLRCLRQCECKTNTKKNCVFPFTYQVGFAVCEWKSSFSGRDLQQVHQRWIWKWRCLVCNGGEIFKSNPF